MLALSLVDRWRRAETLTDERMAEVLDTTLLDATLTAGERAELLELSRALDAAAKA